jgi:hypothetical protein
MAGLPGPTGPRNPPAEPENDPRQGPDREPLVVDSFDFEATDGGKLLATVVVRNRTGTERSVTVVGRAEVDGERFVETAEGVEVPGEGTLAVDLVFDASYEAFERDGSFRPELE